MAAQHGVDLAAVDGTGVGGRIRKQDVLDAAQKQGTDKHADAAGGRRSRGGPARRSPRLAGRRRHRRAPAPSPLRGKTEPMTRLRKVIAKRMVESLQTQRPADHGGRGRRHRRSRGCATRPRPTSPAREGVKLSYLPFFAKAAIDALKAAPELNAAIDTEKGEVTYYDRENLAIAVDTEKRPADPGDQGRRRPVDRRAGPQDRRRRRAHPHQQDQPGRAVRRHLHADQHRQPRRAVRHPDHQPAAGRDPRHRRGGEAAGRDRRPEPRRDDRGTPDGLPRADLRPPARRRRRRRPLPHRRQGSGSRPASSRSEACTSSSVAPPGSSGPHLVEALRARRAHHDLAGTPERRRADDESRWDPAAGRDRRRR